jgi:hypothetical protein
MTDIQPHSKKIHFGYRFLRFLGRCCLFILAILLWILACLAPWFGLDQIGFAKDTMTDGSVLIWSGWLRVLAGVILGLLPMAALLVFVVREWLPAHAAGVMGIGSLATLVFSVWMQIASAVIILTPVGMTVRDQAWLGSAERANVRFADVEWVVRRDVGVWRNKRAKYGVKRNGRERVNRSDWYWKPRDKSEVKLDLGELPRGDWDEIEAAFSRAGITIKPAERLPDIDEDK